MSREPGDVEKDLYAMTQEEIAEILGVTKSAIIQLEKKALAKITAKLIERGFDFEDFFGEKNEHDWMAKAWTKRAKRANPEPRRHRKQS
jgi:transcriptional regulator with XRE-family HTH domain